MSITFKALLLTLLLAGSAAAQVVVGGGGGGGTGVGPGYFFPASFGAKGGVLRCNGFDTGVTLTITNASSNITASCFSPTNTTLQVGWTCFATNWAGNDANYNTSALILAQTTVATTSGTGAFTTVGTASGSTAGTNGTLFCGPQDDTTALNLAGAAALLNKVDCGVVVLGSRYFFSGGLWNTTPTCPSAGTGPSAYGGITGLMASGGGAELIPLPTFTYTGAGGCLGGSGANVCIGGFRGESLSNFSVDGGGQPVGGAHSVIVVKTNTDGTYENLMVNGWLTTATASAGLDVNGGYHTMHNMTIDGAGISNCVFHAFWNIAYAVFCGNGNGQAAQDSAGSQGTCYGCFFQGQATSSTLSINGMFEMLGGGFSAPPGVSNCAVVASGGILTIQHLGCQNTANTGSGAFSVSGTGVLKLRDTNIIQGGATGKAIFINNTTATVLNEGGNVFSGTTGLTPAITGTLWGTGPTITPAAGTNSPESFNVLVTEGTGTPSTGTIIVTFGQTFSVSGNPPDCHISFYDGTGTWTIPTDYKITTNTVTAVTFQVTNGGTLTAGSTYGVQGGCTAR